MKIKKRISGSWNDTPHYIHNTATDTLTTLPAVLYPNAATATVGLKGNTTQNGTPTPDNPVMPQGTGDKTANLFDEVYPNLDYTIRYLPIYVGEGTFTASTTTPKVGTSASLWILQGNVSSGATVDNSFYDKQNKTVTADNGYITIAYRITTTTGQPTVNPSDYDVMLNVGSTALPYEPYGYKIPISSGETTTPVYLGEVESTRRIKKLVLTGEEEWYSSGTYTGSMYAYNSQFSGIAGNKPIYCSHLQYTSNASDYSIGKCKTDDNSVSLWIFNTTTSPTSFKAYLADQYANGTPVTIWYVLATEETAVVNEPLCKIGDYADEVSGITIPTIAGANTISVDTTLQPSEVTVNYKGWHPVADAHEYSSGSWD